MPVPEPPIDPPDLYAPENPECECGHAYDQHEQYGCLSKGCPCPEFADAGPPEPDEDEGTDR
jgi:hypothetical protein